MRPLSLVQPAGLREAVIPHRLLLGREITSCSHGLSFRLLVGGAGICFLPPSRILIWQKQKRRQAQAN